MTKDIGKKGTQLHHTLAGSIYLQHFSSVLAGQIVPRNDSTLLRNTQQQASIEQRHG